MMGKRFYWTPGPLESMIPQRLVGFDGADVVPLALIYDRLPWIDPGFSTILLIKTGTTDSILPASRNWRNDVSTA